MILNLVDYGEKVDDKFISSFEQELNINLPEEYKAFMIKNNGGMPEDDVVFDYYDNVTESQKRAVIQEFYIMYSENNFEVDNIRNICEGFWKDKAIPVSMFPIGADPAGNIICISLLPNEYGKIYFYNHEYENVDTGYMMESKVADSFDAFLGLLYVIED